MVLHRLAEPLFPSVHHLQIPSYVLIPCSVIIGAWLVFLFLWLQLDRPDKTGTYQDPKDYSFPRWGNTHSTGLMAKDKAIIIIGLVTLFMAVCFLASVDVDRAQAGVAFYFYTTVALFAILGLLAAGLYAHAALRNELLSSFFVLAVFTLITAYSTGIFNFYVNVSPYMAARTGKHYISVVPTVEASAFQDAGRIDFGPMTRLMDDTTVGYKLNNDIYCTAPIVDANVEQQNDRPTLQFFAVGKNCCNHEGRFDCIDANSLLTGSSDGDTLLGGYTVSKLQTVDELGFFQKWIKDLNNFLVHGVKLQKSDFDIYRSQADAVAKTVQRSVSDDAVFVELGSSSSTTYSESLVSIQNALTGNYLQLDLRLNATANPIWYYAKAPSGNTYNILTVDKSTDQLKYLGMDVNTGELALKPRDSGTGRERFTLNADGGPFQLATGEYFARQETTENGQSIIKAVLLPNPPVPAPKFRIVDPNNFENRRPKQEIEHRFTFFGPFLLYGSWSGLGVWLVAGFLYFLFLIMVLSALRPGEPAKTESNLTDMPIGGGAAAAVPVPREAAM
ncbi:unnamed protein product [Amoebophrya sp. A120]|nr:unnamed protein product [Amoebophrya sp. A120]|eukprot:GSA120T00008974001.1